MKEKIAKSICKTICLIGKKITEKNVNSTCITYSYQPELPIEALKLKKHE